MGLARVEAAAGARFEGRLGLPWDHAFLGELDYVLDRTHGLVELVPATGEVRRIELEDLFLADVGFLASDEPGGRLLAIVRPAGLGSWQLLRIDPATGLWEVLDSAFVGQPLALAVGETGAAYVARAAGGRVVIDRFGPTRGVSRGWATLGVAHVGGLAVQAGAVWATDPAAGALWKIPMADRKAASRIGVKLASPVDVAAAPGGLVVMTAAGARMVVPPERRVEPLPFAILDDVRHYRLAPRCDGLPLVLDPEAGMVYRPDDEGELSLLAARFSRVYEVGGPLSPGLRLVG